jgi:predicted RNA-binding Zn-ribbon protein involved in translation (DUF1610 family)
MSMKLRRSPWENARQAASLEVIRSVTSVRAAPFRLLAGWDVVSLFGHTTRCVLSMKAMSRSPSNTEFSCPSCGASSALWFPDSDPQRLDVTLKCLSCGTLMRLPKDKVVGAGSSVRGGPIGPSEVSSTL